MKLGCSYFGNRILKHFLVDLRELQEMGCTFVVHTYSENDMVFCHAAVADLVAATKEAGLEAWIDPWGVGKVFGGEAFSNFVMQNVDAMQVLSDGLPAGLACPNHPRFRSFMREWIDAAASTGAQVAFWDEPHFYIPTWMGGRPNTWGCRCEHCQRLFEQINGYPMPTEETDQVHSFKEHCIVSKSTALRSFSVSSRATQLNEACATHCACSPTATRLMAQRTGSGSLASVPSKSSERTHTGWRQSATWRITCVRRRARLSRSQRPMVLRHRFGFRGLACQRERKMNWFGPSRSCAQRECATLPCGAFTLVNTSRGFARLVPRWRGKRSKKLFNSRGHGRLALKRA